MDIKKDIMPKFSWVELSVLGESKLVKSLMIWLIIVPILAKIFDQLPDKIIINIFNNNIGLFLLLPFNILCFYISALLFTLGGIIYKLKCPSIIQKRVHLSKNINNGNGLAEYLYELNIMEKKVKDKVLENFKNVKEKEGCNNNLLEDTNEEAGIMEKLSIINTYVDETKLLYVNYRIAILIIYLTALLLIGVIFIQNSHVVLSQAFK